MMKNEVVLAGLINGEFTELKNDGLLFTVSDIDKDGKTKDFLVTAYSDNAKLIRSKTKSGDRIVVIGRLGREELVEGTKAYHDIIQTVKILSLGGIEGNGYAKAYLEGLGTATDIRRTRNGDGPSVLNIDIKHERTFKNRTTNEEQTHTSYHKGVLWKERAEAVESKLPIDEAPLAISGNLMPSKYASTKHNGMEINKLEIWGDDLYFAGVGTTASAPAPSTAPKASSDSRRGGSVIKSSSDGEIPF